MTSLSHPDILAFENKVSFSSNFKKKAEAALLLLRSENLVLMLVAEQNALGCFCKPSERHKDLAN